MSRPAAALLAWVLASTAGATAVETLLRTGPPDRRLDLVILGDGYRAQDQQKLSTDARDLLNGLLAIAPYHEYRGLLNVKLIHVVSRQEGADNGSFHTLRDTALGAYYNCGGIDYLLCVDYDAVYTYLARETPEYDVGIVLVNDSDYGGSGGSIAVASKDVQSLDILRHELGHTLASLADEYEAPYDYPVCDPVQDCFEPNVTLRSTRADVKWNAWINPATPVPTPESASYPGIGLFEGARYLSAGIYRPRYERCLMRELGYPYCSVCAEALVRTLWRFSVPAERQAPPGPVAEEVCNTLAFGVATPPLENPTITYAWTVDGAPVVASGPVMEIRAGTLPPGDHLVQVRVQDGTTLVRSDPTGLLQGAASWPVTSTACSGPCDAGQTCGTPLCVGGMSYAVPTCDTAGQCGSIGAGVSCGAYACDGQGLACRTQCATSVDCAPGQGCQDAGCIPIENLTVDLPDAGTSDPDHGTSEPPSGCGCGAGGGSGWAALLALALAGMALRSRARR